MPVLMRQISTSCSETLNIIQTHPKVHLPDVGLLKHKMYLRPITARKSPLLATRYLLQPSPCTLHERQRHSHIQTHCTQCTMVQWGSRTLNQACFQAYPESAMCVQNFDDSRGPAIRITYRISLRSSSLWEPRHPLLKVVCYYRCIWGGELREHKL